MSFYVIASRIAPGCTPTKRAKPRVSRDGAKPGYARRNRRDLDQHVALLVQNAGRELFIKWASAYITNVTQNRFLIDSYNWDYYVAAFSCYT